MTRGLRADQKTKKRIGNPMDMPESTKKGKKERKTGDDQRRNQELRTVSG